MNWRTAMRTDLGALARGGREPVRRGGWPGPRAFLPGRRHCDLALLTKHLESLVGANVDLVGGLDALARNAPRRLARLYHVLSNDMACGASLAGAMRTRSGFFPRYYCDLVESGESTGALKETFTGLNDYLENRRGGRDTVSGWSAYLVFLLLVQGLLVTFLALKVFPVFMEINDEFGFEGPGSIHLVNLIGNFLFRYWWVVLDAAISAVVVVLVVRYLLRSRGLFDDAAGWLVAHAPFLNVLLVKHDLAHVSLALERLLAGGVPLDRALEDAATLDVNPVYARVLKRLSRRVFEGDTLRDAMARESRSMLPASFRGLISIGERSGLLAEAFGRLGRLYSQEAAKTRRVLAQGLMPLFLALPASVVLLITYWFFAVYGGLLDGMLGQL